MRSTRLAPVAEQLRLPLLVDLSDCVSGRANRDVQVTPPNVFREHLRDQERLPDFVRRRCHRAGVAHKRGLRGEILQDGELRVVAQAGDRLSRPAFQERMIIAGLALSPSIQFAP